MSSTEPTSRTSRRARSRGDSADRSSLLAGYGRKPTADPPAGVRRGMADPVPRYRTCPLSSGVAEPPGPVRHRARWWTTKSCHAKRPPLRRPQLLTATAGPTLSTPLAARVHRITARRRWDGDRQLAGSATNAVKSSMGSVTRHRERQPPRLSKPTGSDPAPSHRQ
jgi:hypothetical protein